MKGGSVVKIFIRKWYKTIGTTLSLIFNSFGLILSIVGIITNGNKDVSTTIVFFVLLAAEIFLILSIIYSIFSVFNDKSKLIKVNEKINEIERLTNANRIIFENNKSIVTTFKDCTDTLSLRIKSYLGNNMRLNELNGQLCSDEKKKEYEELDDNAKNKIFDHVKIERTKEFFSFRDTLIDDYNRFLGNITIILRRSLEEYISTKNCSSNISVTVKQLNEPTFYNQIDKKKVRVFTAFRDNRTYNSKKRIETWQKSFSIDKNSDFAMSIEKEYYIFNFIEKQHLEQGLYQNETVSFYENYNSGVTCTIHSCVEGERKLFGYLACDSLFDLNVKKKYGRNIFDWNCANLMMYTAHIIAMYLEKYLTIWDSYCVDFNPDEPISMRTPEFLENKEKDLHYQYGILSQELSQIEDTTEREKIEFKKQKIEKEIDKLSANSFCNVMIDKINNSRYHN